MQYPFTLRQLQYVVAIAEAGGFRAAARRCHVSQPSLSAQISSVEDALGQQLFERRAQGTVTTCFGRQFADSARQILKQCDLLIAKKETSLPLELSIGVIPTIAPYLFPGADDALASHAHEATIRWNEAMTDALVATLEGGSIQAILAADDPKLGGLERIWIGHEPFLLAASNTHPLGCCEREVDPHALEDQEVFLMADGHCFRDHVLDLCARKNATSHGISSNSIPTLIRVTEARGGVTLLPAMAARYERGHELVLRPFTSPTPGRDIVLAHKHTMSPSSRAVLEAIARTLRDAISNIGVEVPGTSPSSPFI